MGYSRYGSQVLPDEGAQNTCTRTVQDAYAADSYQDSIIDEIGDCLYGFVSAHTSDIDVLLEIQFLFVHPVLGFAANKSCFVR